MLILVNLHVNQSIKPYLIFFLLKKKKKKNHLLVHDFFGKNSFYDENFFPFFFFFAIYILCKGGTREVKTHHMKTSQGDN